MESVEDHIAENLVYGKRNENDLTLTTQSPCLKTLKKRTLENIVEKGENYIPICPYFWHQLSLFAAKLEEPKISIPSKGLTLYQTTKFWTLQT